MDEIIALTIALVAVVYFLIRGEKGIPLPPLPVWLILAVSAVLLIAILTHSILI